MSRRMSAHLRCRPLAACGRGSGRQAHYPQSTPASQYEHAWGMVGVSKHADATTFEDIASRMLPWFVLLAIVGPSHAGS